MDKSQETPAQSPAKHRVQRGVAYVELASGKLVRNYVVLGGKRVYVDAKEGDEVTTAQAKKANK
jgi:hypothetical protein